MSKLAKPLMSPIKEDSSEEKESDLNEESQSDAEMNEDNSSAKDVNDRLDELKYKKIINEDHKNDDKIKCDMCLSLASSDNDLMVICELCLGAVHQSCYKGELRFEIPKHEWHCHRCAYLKGDEKAKIKDAQCGFCKELLGVMTRIEDLDLGDNNYAKWAHPLCVQWNPYLSYENEFEKKKVVPHQGFKLDKCTRCQKLGACIYCDQSQCQVKYHIPCARKEGLIFDFEDMIEKGYVSPINEQYVGFFCKMHRIDGLQTLREGNIEHYAKSFRDRLIQSPFKHFERVLVSERKILKIAPNQLDHNLELGKVRRRKRKQKDQPVEQNQEGDQPMEVKQEENSGKRKRRKRKKSPENSTMSSEVEQQAAMDLNSVERNLDQRINEHELVSYGNQQDIQSQNVQNYLKALFYQCLYSYIQQQAGFQIQQLTSTGSAQSAKSDLKYVLDQLGFQYTPEALATLENYIFSIGLYQIAQVRSQPQITGNQAQISNYQSLQHQNIQNQAFQSQALQNQALQSQALQNQALQNQALQTQAYQAHALQAQAQNLQSQVQNLQASNIAATLPAQTLASMPNFSLSESQPVKESPSKGSKKKITQKGMDTIFKQMEKDTVVQGSKSFQKDKMNILKVVSNKDSQNIGQKKVSAQSKKLGKKYEAVQMKNSQQEPEEEKQIKYRPNEDLLKILKFKDKQKFETNEWFRKEEIVATFKVLANQLNVYVKDDQKGNVFQIDRSNILKKVFLCADTIKETEIWDKLLAKNCELQQ